MTTGTGESHDILEAANQSFRAHHALEDLAHAQHTPIFTGMNDLRGFVMADWPADETIDDMLEYLHEQRKRLPTYR